MLRSERYRHFVDYFSKHQPNAVTELHYSSPYQLLVAVILSAQCTDKRINQVTPALFERFPSPASLAASTPEEVFTYIRSVSYPNNKAKHLVGMAKMLVEVFNGEVPSALEDLQKMPGVGRKTANVISSVVFDAPAIAVDTEPPDLLLFSAGEAVRRPRAPLLRRPSDCRCRFGRRRSRCRARGRGRMSPSGSRQRSPARRPGS